METSTLVADAHILVPSKHKDVRLHGEDEVRLQVKIRLPISVPRGRKKSSPDVKEENGRESDRAINEREGEGLGLTCSETASQWILPGALGEERNLADTSA